MRHDFLFHLSLIAILTTTAALPAKAAKVDVKKEDGFSVILIDGDLVLGDEKKFADAAISSADALVVMGSNGGNLFSGIEIGKAIRLKGFTTLVPDHTRCASACALAWLGGRIRAMGTTAEVGFHAAYDADDGKVTSSGNALVGAYLSQLGLPSTAVVYITEPPPNSIRWLTASDAAKYGIDVKVLSLPRNDQASNAHRSTQPLPNNRSVNSNLERAAVTTVQRIYDGLQGDNNSVLLMLNNLYSDEVLYFGRNLDKNSILADKNRFFSRWPNRIYRLNNDQIYVSCLGKSCTVNGQLFWEASAPQRKAEANGSASFSYTLDFTGGNPLIVAETSTVTERDLSNHSKLHPIKSPAADLHRIAKDFILYVFKKCSEDNLTAKALYNEVYSDRVNYYGKYRDKKSVLNDKFNFLLRWPMRQYSVDPNKIVSNCSETLCEIRGSVDWVVKSDRRKALSQGTSTFVYVVDFSTAEPVINSENSANTAKKFHQNRRPIRGNVDEDDILSDIEF